MSRSLRSALVVAEIVQRKHEADCYTSRRWEYIALWNSSSFLSLLQLPWVLERTFPFSGLHVPSWTPRHHLYPTSPCYVFFRSSMELWENKYFSPLENTTNCITVNCNSNLWISFQPKASFLPLTLPVIFKLNFSQRFFFSLAFE